MQVCRAEQYLIGCRCGQVEPALGQAQRQVGLAEVGGGQYRGGVRPQPQVRGQLLDFAHRTGGVQRLLAAPVEQQHHRADRCRSRVDGDRSEGGERLGPAPESPVQGAGPANRHTQRVGIGGPVRQQREALPGPPLPAQDLREQERRGHAFRVRAGDGRPGQPLREVEVEPPDRGAGGGQRDHRVGWSTRGYLPGRHAQQVLVAAHRGRAQPCRQGPVRRPGADRPEPGA